MKKRWEQHWVAKALFSLWLAGLLVSSGLMLGHGAAEQQVPVSCPLAERVAELELALDRAEAEQIRAEIDWTERMMQMSHSVGVGDVDVACLYRGHVLHTHDGHPAHEVRDKPVPGAWEPLSPLIEPPTRAECMERFR